MEKIWNEITSFLKTLVCFLAALIIIPVLLILFVIVHYTNALVNYILSIKYPQLQISTTKKIRSLIDTPRNAGIFNFLLHVKGPCDFDAIRKQYEEHLTNAREKTGYLKFPKLRQKLVNCWGHYGWVKDTSTFNVNNHILLNTSAYRGCPVHDGNIQEFVSTLMEKYIPSDLPQWQVIVIPITPNKSVPDPANTDADTAQEDHYYILLKIHHLIIAEEDDLHISEMLMVEDNTDKPVIEIGGLPTNAAKTNGLSYFVRKPEHIENLINYTERLIINQWNKFIYEFESLERPDGCSGIQIGNITQLMSVLLIVTVNVIINYYKDAKIKKKRFLRHPKQRTDREGKLQSFKKILIKEIDHRQLSWNVAKSAVQSSLQISNLTKTWASFVWRLNVGSVVTLPHQTYCEIIALKDLIVRGQTTMTDTYCGRLSVLLPMLIYSNMELLRICYDIFKAPVNIYEVLVQYPSREVNKLHKMSYSGRKIASFSKSIDARVLRKRNAFNDDLRESDFTLSCLAAAIHDFFEFYAKDAAIPKIVNTTCRTIAKGYFTDNLGDKTDFIGGVVFLQLPLRVPDRQHATQIHSIVEQIRRKQIMIYLSSMGQTKYDMLTSIFPRVLTKVCINYFSSNFPITITEIHGENSEFQTLWGQTVDDVLLFRPPQSKTFVHYTNALVNYILSIKYPQLQISTTKKIRSLIDTPRNAGIFNFLLHVKGPCDFDAIRKQYEEHLTNAREKTGYLKFPKLRQKLVNCWGHYGWVKDTSTFNVNNHILLNTSAYRGCPVHDGNIQEFVSTLMEKYIPSDLPQWQVIVIPITPNKSVPDPANTDADTAQEDHYYILLKIHHLIIAEEDDLHISEMLMVEDNTDKPVIEIGGLPTNAAKTNGLSYFVRKPEHIENLINYTERLIINQWNKFIYEFESLERPDGCSGIQIGNITQLMSVLLIVTVNVIINYYKDAKIKKKRFLRHPKQRTDREGKLQSFKKILIKEIDHRQLSWNVAKSAVQSSLQISNLTKTWASFVWRLNVGSVVTLPHQTYCEIIALKDLIVRGQTTMTDTYCGRLSVLLPMLIYSNMELLRICYDIFKAPVNIYEVLVQYPSREVNKLHKMSYSGRKIASFSKSIDARVLRKRNAFNDDLRESDFTLSCLAAAIHDFFEFYAKDAAIPKIVNTTCRTIAKGYFTDNLGDKTDFIGGVVFLQLPLRVPDRQHATQIHSIVEQIRRKQIMIYLSSMGQTKYDMLTSIFPRVLTKVCINYFSSNFPITITEIHGENSEFQTLWGQTVDDVLLFRPPQSKTCLSLNIHRFGDRYRLAVMADTQLGPEHSKIARSFENYMETVIL